MLIEFDPDDYETRTTSHTCPYHKKHPGKAYAGCTCSGSYALVLTKIKGVPITDSETDDG